MGRGISGIRGGALGIGSLLISCSLDAPRCFLLNLEDGGLLAAASCVPDLVRRRKLKEPRRREGSRSPGDSGPAGESLSGGGDLPKLELFDMKGEETMIATSVQGPLFEGSREPKPYTAAKGKLQQNSTNCS